MKFIPNGSSKFYDVSSIDEIRKIINKMCDGFSNIRKDGNLILANVGEDPLNICVGKIEN